MAKSTKNKSKDTYIKKYKGQSGILVIDGKELPRVKQEYIDNAKLFFDDFNKRVLFGEFTK